MSPFNAKTLIAPLLLAASPVLAGVHVYVHIGPPPPPREVLLAAPGPDYVWVPGYHRWDGGAYVWVAGRWEQPPRHGVRWVHGSWRHDRHGYYWVEGGWR